MKDTNFFEASSIRKIGSIYYLVYSSVQSHELCYAISHYPDRDFHFGGTLVDIGDVFLNGKTADEAINALGNTHGGIEKCGNQWYVFYHRQTNRTNYSRQGCAEKISIDENGHIEQVEVTSCGLNDGPLLAEGTFPANICCHLTGEKGAAFSHPDIMKMEYPFLTQDCPDLDGDDERMREDPHNPIQYIHNIQNGSIIGYKYFLFSGTEKVTVCIRGKGTGYFLMSTGLHETPCGKISICAEDDRWNTFTENLNVVGTYPLYLEYKGKGSIDIKWSAFT